MRGTWEGQKPALIVCFLMLRESFAFKHKPKELPKAWSLFGENTELFNSLYCPFSRTVCNGRSWEPSDYLESISWEFKPFCLCVKNMGIAHKKDYVCVPLSKKKCWSKFFSAPEQCKGTSWTLWTLLRVGLQELFVLALLNKHTKGTFAFCLGCSCILNAKKGMQFHSWVPGMQ